MPSQRPEEALAPSEPEKLEEEHEEPLKIEPQSVQENDRSLPVHEEEKHRLPTSSEGDLSPDSSLAPPLYDDPENEDDGEGEWITPGNVALHKSKHLDLLPSSSAKSKLKEIIRTGCMTADFAMQNVLLQMGLNLVGTEGKRIQRLKTWVLRCHACFK
jgi:RNA-binding protein NOB1